MKRIVRALGVAVLSVLLVGTVLYATNNTWNFPVPTLGGLVAGDLIYARSSYALGNITAVASGQVLTSAGTGTIPAWSASPTLTGITVSGLTASKPVFSSAASALTSSGTMPVDQGGTNLTSYAVGDILYASAATTLNKLANVAVGQTLVSAGVTTAPAYSATPRLGKQLRTVQAVAPTCADTAKCSTIVGSDSAGIITIGATPANDFVVTFNAAWAAAPACTAANQTSAANYVTKVLTATNTMTISSAAGPSASDNYSYICLGVQ